MVKAFLIGAGATRAQFSEAPLTEDFFLKLRTHSPEVYSAFENILQPYINDELRNQNIEKIMLLSYEFPESHKQPFLSNVFLAIHNLIVKTTFNKPFTENRIGPDSLFKTLLNDKRLHFDDFFMTLNYDLYLDREIYSVLHNIDYGILGKYINSKQINYPPQNEWSLYHLHGSLNWYWFPNENKINIESNAISPSFTRDGSNLCIIPPGKKELNPVIKTLWDKASVRLANADELIIIGCSLNPDDIELITLVKEFVNNKGPENVKVIYKDDFHLQNNYNEIFEYGSGYHLYPYGFDLHGINKPPHRPPPIEFIFEK